MPHLGILQLLQAQPAGQEQAYPGVGTRVPELFKQASLNTSHCL